MSTEFTTLGRLNCRIVDHRHESPAPELIVILCHGFGAPGEDLLPLGDELSRRESALAERAIFIFPEAPLDLAAWGMPGGRAWWPLDVERLTAAIEAGELRAMREELPDGLPEARDQLLGLIEAAGERFAVDHSRIVLGGFSQGAMLATEAALTLPMSPAGLIIFSGTLLCESRWRQQADRHQGLPVFQSHGEEDPLLPFQAAEWLRQALEESGLEVEFVRFHGMHTIPYEILQQAARFLGRRIPAKE